MNNWLLIIVTILSCHYLLEMVVELLNRRTFQTPLPIAVQGVYDEKEYQNSIAYQFSKNTFFLLHSSIGFVVTVTFLICGGFGYVDNISRSFRLSEIPTGVIFAAIIALLSFLLSLPFSLYSTFVMEQRYGFNKTTPKTYLSDVCKGAFLLATFGGTLFAMIQWFFLTFPDFGWLYCWAGVVVFTFVLQFLSPAIIMPLFNTFTPLPDTPLRRKLLAYAEKEQFVTSGIFTMDGSKRSTKLNAFFVGFGRFRKIALFDTLLEKLEDDEILAVLAHEVGHFKLKHIWKFMLGSVLQMGILFYLLNIFLEYPAIVKAAGVSEPHVYSSLIFFGLLYAPISTFINIIFNYFSRNFEFAADTFSAMTAGNPSALCTALKKLSQANFSHLTPHPFKVFVSYTHPPLLQRLENLQRLTKRVEAIGSYNT
jgi:STE24 endopeptidase